MERTPPVKPGTPVLAFTAILASFFPQMAWPPPPHRSNWLLKILESAAIMPAPRRGHMAWSPILCIAAHPLLRLARLVFLHNPAKAYNNVKEAG